MEKKTSGHLCQRCHAEAIFGFADTWLCEDCYGIVGSCCMEFDGDDQFLETRSWWESRIETKSAAGVPDAQPSQAGAGSG
jgi:hypothetical protein